MGKQQGVGYAVNAVYGGRIGHNGESSCTETFQERSELFFPQVLVIYDGRSTVQSVSRNAVAHIMFKTGCYIFAAHVVRIRALQPFYHFTSYFSSQVAIFTVAFPLAGPGRLTSHIHNRAECPRDPCRPGFIGGDFPGTAGQFPVECRRHIYTLGKKSAVGHIGASVYLVNTVKTRNPNGFERFILNDLYDPVPFCGSLCRRKGSIQDGSYFIFHKNRVHFSRIELKSF